MPCPPCPKLALRSRASSLDLLQSSLQVTSLISSTNSHQSATVLTSVGALLKPSGGRHRLALAQNGKPTPPKPLAGRSRDYTGMPEPLPPSQSPRQRPDRSPALHPSLATNHSSLPFLIASGQNIRIRCKTRRTNNAAYVNRWFFCRFRGRDTCCAQAAAKV
jgi:hypothetical protein